MEEEVSCCHQNRSSHKGPVTDIRTPLGRILLCVVCCASLTLSNQGATDDGISENHFESLQDIHCTRMGNI